MRHPHLADSSDSCLVVVDMQEPFLRNMFDREAVTENARRLIEAAKILGLPILVTLQYPDKMGDTVPEIKDILPPHEPIGKMTFSCCGDSEFNRRLRALRRKTVILTGVEAHICVSQTAHDLAVRGYTVHVPEDAVCSRTERDWRVTLERLRQNQVWSGTVVTTTEAVIFELLGCAGTEEFREVLKLVK